MTNKESMDTIIAACTTYLLFYSSYEVATHTKFIKDTWKSGIKGKFDIILRALSIWSTLVIVITVYMILAYWADRNWV